MAKDDKDKGKSGEGGLDLLDLMFGTLNFLRDDSINDSGDRRRGNPLSFLVQAMTKAYGIDALKDVTDFRGIVLDSHKVDGVVPINRSEILNAYLNISLGGKILKAIKGDKTVYAYKVFIPELEMRPPPESIDDPIIDTYANVYDGRIKPDTIELGTVVTVVFEDFKNLLNPRIVAAEKKPLIIKELFEGNVTEALKNFFSGNPQKEKVGDHKHDPRAPLPPATDEQVPSERGLLPNGSPQADYPGGSPPYILPLNVSRMKSDRMYLNNTVNPVNGRRERHHAVDHGASSGTPILAIADGEVTFTRAGSAEAGNYIVMRHTDVINGGNLWVRQLHMVRPTALSVGDRVTQGQVIGHVGSTGRSTGPHVHFEIGKTYPGTYKGSSTKSSMDHKINPIGYYPDGWFVTHAGKAYTFPDRMKATPGV